MEVWSQNPDDPGLNWENFVLRTDLRWTSRGCGDMWWHNPKNVGILNLVPILEPWPWSLLIGGCIKSVRISPIALLACYIELMTMQKKQSFRDLHRFRGAMLWVFGHPYTNLEKQVLYMPLRNPPGTFYSFDVWMAAWVYLERDHGSWQFRAIRTSSKQGQSMWIPPPQAWPENSAQLISDNKHLGCFFSRIHRFLQILIGIPWESSLRPWFSEARNGPNLRSPLMKWSRRHSMDLVPWILAGCMSSIDVGKRWVRNPC